ncbi:hypothetical protein CC78DRAFT_541175 [Lojkania enalia]|uniref:Uncharacterized protein n=1 Tax=Lojkania enalia TaxID=147567 RepID=A0A9P4KGZ2_9PLEO|nr:hypothetical protein CC78DRAFT_541175 [Didymosphaeria enalia]
MANLTSPRLVAELGRKHIQDHKLVFDAPVNIRNSNQRSSSDDTAQGSTYHADGRGSGQSAGEEVANEDDDEDSSSDQDDAKDNDEDTPEVNAPSCGRGLGKGKCPGIRAEHIDDEDSHDDDEDVESHEAGLKTSKHPLGQLLMGVKKRTYSNVSNTSLLFGDDDGEHHAFPRRKMARKLSSTNLKPLLTYKENDDTNGLENAIESSDEDKCIDIDDEDYSGVNFISDESDMEQQEEDYIVNQELHKEYDIITAPRRFSLNSAPNDHFFDFNDPVDENLITASTLSDIGFGQFFEPEPVPTSPEPNINRKYSNSSSKRVRFDDEVQVSDSSSSSASELDSSLWPDLFMEQEKLPTSIYQMIENDNETENAEEFFSSGSEQSYWDVGQDESRIQPLTVDEEFDEESSNAGSSGYETDMGDTTDEDDSDMASDGPPQTPIQKSVLRRPSSAPASRATSPRPFQRSSRTPVNGKVLIPPIRGIFVHEESGEAIAVTNRATKTLTFYRPRTTTYVRRTPYATYSSTASTTNNSPRTSLQHFNASDSEISNDAFINPFQNATDIMLTGIFGSAPTNNYLFGGDSIGPPEAFFPFISVEQNGNINWEEEDEYDDDEDYEDDLNITDFMDFGSDKDATDVERDDETEVPATPATSMVAFPGSTPAQPTPTIETPTSRKWSQSDVMLEHFDRGVVTAFRNNQNRFRDIASLPYDPNLRASVSRPIRSGKSAETLMSPLRKRSSTSKRNPAPFAGVTKAAGRLQSSVMGTRRGPPMGTFS